VPLSELPRLAVNIGWSAILIVTSFTAVWPVLRGGGRAAVPFAVLMFGIFFGMAAGGNVHGLMIAWLVFGVERRSGPVLDRPGSVAEGGADPVRAGLRRTRRVAQGG